MIFSLAYLMSVGFVVVTALLFEGEVVFFDTYLTVAFMWLLTAFAAFLRAIYGLLVSYPSRGGSGA